MKLIIVESPTKAKTLNQFLGDKYDVVASMGHIRDLPSNKMNIDVDNKFKPTYALAPGKGKVVKELQDKAKKASEVLLAMDPDREGEAIAHHVKYVIAKGLGKDKDSLFRRITFHQITKDAVEEAISHAGKIDEKLVEAQQSRRILDRLVGYSLSPVLWKKIRRGLSAGRVQSVALRLVVDREKEIKKFKPQEYWEVMVLVKTKDRAVANNEFWIELVEVEGKKLVEGKGDERKFLLGSKKIVEPVVADLRKADYKVLEVDKREVRRSANPPYITSTLQQAAANKFGWSGKRTMSVAQGLYEKGLITYHRTDSFHLAAEAVKKAREYIEREFGKEYLPEKPNFFKTKSKSAQEAHEAIRPTSVGKQMDGKKQAGMEGKLYGLIWRRFVASQMSPAVVDATTVTVEASGKRKCILKATGAVTKFKGWKAAYGGSSKSQISSSKQIQNSNDQNSRSSEEVELPEVEDGEELKYLDLNHEQKETQPLPRFNDASLVKELERLGIGRPSTYAPTISTLIGRGYMERNERRFYPSPVGMVVTDFLKDHFKEIMDYGFTADMEDDLDKIAAGERKWVPLMEEFWGPFDKLVKQVSEKAERVAVPVEKTGKKCPECKKGEVVIRSGRFGKFLSCSRFPECKYTGKLVEKVKGIKCEKCKKGDVVVKKTRRGRSFFGCSRYPKCDWASWTDPRKGGEADKQKGGKAKGKKGEKAGNG